jgi:hypothetical protein
VWEVRLKAADLASGIECKYRWPRRNSGSILLVQVRCAELCQNPSDWGLGRSVLSERQIPQVVVFSRKSLEKGERLARAFVRPRQVRYQAALRPDIIGKIDSKARRHFVPLGASSNVRVTASHARVRVSFATLAAGKRNTGVSPLISICVVFGAIACRCSNVL